MRVARPAPVCISGRSARRMLQLYRRFLQSGTPTLRLRLSVPDRIRRTYGDGHRGTLIAKPATTPRKRVNFRVRLQRGEFDADHAATSTGTKSAIVSLSVCY